MWLKIDTLLFFSVLTGVRLTNTVNTRNTYGRKQNRIDRHFEEQISSHFIPMSTCFELKLRRLTSQGKKYLKSIDLYFELIYDW